MSAITVTIDASSFNAAMQKLKGNLDSLIHNIIAQLTYSAEGEMKLRCPVRTGRMRASISTEWPSFLEAFTAPHTDYAIWVELKWKEQQHHGMQKDSAEGFVADTRETIAKEAQTIAERTVQRVIEQL